MATEFLGFNQVTKEYFDSLTNLEKKGKLWFVRTKITEGEEISYSGDIYFGTRHYGHVGKEVANLEERVESLEDNNKIGGDDFRG